VATDDGEFRRRVRDSVAALISVDDRAETDDVCSGLMRRPPTVDVLLSTPSVMSLPGYAAAMGARRS
jgi:hypothetical protein